MKSTSEQDNVINHRQGNALVFAVAGSGKTSSLIGRLSAMVSEGYPAKSMLATTFSREARASLQQKLTEAGVQGVEVMTLHALAARIIGWARQMGLCQEQVGQGGDTENSYSPGQLTEPARALALRLLNEQGIDDKQLISQIKAVKPDDFLTYLGVQKGGLRLPWVPAGLSPEHLKMIDRPDAERPAYAMIYEAHDLLRRHGGAEGGDAPSLIDFDDSIVLAWLLLARHPELRERCHWKHICVDEFQDVSKAQNEMLELITQQTDSYMVIGDDDQTIYQWRGADPGMILDFARRRNATTYTLSANFRCPMDVVALSTTVIAGNVVRAPKHMLATKPGRGIQLHASGDGKMAGLLAASAIRNGTPPQDIVILLRTYAQSALIEQSLLDMNIPYRMIGSLPFYRRNEVQILLAYLELAKWELEAAQRDQQQGAYERWQQSVAMSGHNAQTQTGGPSSPPPMDQRRLIKLKSLWKQVASRPGRYLSSAQIEQIGNRIGRPMNDEMRRRLNSPNPVTGTVGLLLSEMSTSLPKYVSPRTDLLSMALRRMAGKLHQQGGADHLEEFCKTIEYREYLINSAPTQAFGEERTGSVDAIESLIGSRPLIDLQGIIEELSHKALHLEKRGDDGEDGLPRPTIMTAFRAKGLEWPMVIVPGCDDGVYKPGTSGSNAAKEEERRVLYVAMTRTTQKLHLIYNPNNPTSFLVQAGFLNINENHRKLWESLTTPPSQWTAAITSRTIRTIMEHGHHHHIRRWLPWELARQIDARVSMLQAQLAASEISARAHYRHSWEHASRSAARFALCLSDDNPGIGQVNNQFAVMPLSQDELLTTLEPWAHPLPAQATQPPSIIPPPQLTGRAKVNAQASLDQIIRPTTEQQTTPRRRRPVASQAVSLNDPELLVGRSVRHQAWGEGTITRAQGEGQNMTLTIAFANGKARSLMASSVTLL